MSDQEGGGSVPATSRRFCLCDEPDYCLRYSTPGYRAEAIEYRRQHGAAIPKGDDSRDRLSVEAASPDPVPEELRTWFETGAALADRYGLPRFEFLHRVVEVITVLDGGSEPYVVKTGATRTFKTMEAAKRHADAVGRGRHTALIQSAVVFWMTPDEIPGQNARRPEDG